MPVILCMYIIYVVKGEHFIFWFEKGTTTVNNIHSARSDLKIHTRHRKSKPTLNIIHCTYDIIRNILQKNKMQYYVKLLDFLKRAHGFRVYNFNCFRFQSKCVQYFQIKLSIFIAKGWWAQYIMRTYD